MTEFKIKNIDGECYYDFTAKFIHYFSLDPPDCNEAWFMRRFSGKTMLEAFSKFVIDFEDNYEFKRIKDCTIQVVVVPQCETTFQLK